MSVLKNLARIAGDNAVEIGETFEVDGLAMQIEYNIPKEVYQPNLPEIVGRQLQSIGRKLIEFSSQ